MIKSKGTFFKYLFLYIFAPQLDSETNSEYATQQ